MYIDSRTTREIKTKKPAKEAGTEGERQREKERKKEESDRKRRGGP